MATHTGRTNHDYSMGYKYELDVGQCCGAVRTSCMKKRLKLCLFLVEGKVAVVSRIKLILRRLRFSKQLTNQPQTRRKGVKKVQHFFFQVIKTKREFEINVC